MLKSKKEHILCLRRVVVVTVDVAYDPTFGGTQRAGQVPPLFETEVSVFDFVVCHRRGVVDAAADLVVFW